LLSDHLLRARNHSQRIAADEYVDVDRYAGVAVYARAIRIFLGRRIES
jgi:hypothetical protein